MAALLAGDDGDGGGAGSGVDELVGALLPWSRDDDDGARSEVAETMGLAASSGLSWCGAALPTEYGGTAVDEGSTPVVLPARGDCDGCVTARRRR